MVLSIREDILEDHTHIHRVKEVNREVEGKRVESGVGERVDEVDNIWWGTARASFALLESLTCSTTSILSLLEAYLLY